MKPPRAALTVPSLFVLLLALPAPAEIIERVVAKVNGEIVSLSEFQARQLAAVQAARIASAQVERFLQENNARILEEAIQDLLVVQRADELGIRVPPGTLNEVIESIKKENNIASEAAMQEQLAREGMSLDDLKRTIERQILRRQVIARELESKLTLTDADIRADYEARKAEYTKPATVHLQEMVVAAEDGGALARDLVARARGGEDFGALARARSTSPTRGAGGDLGNLAAIDMSPEIARVAASLAVGAVSDPLPVADGYRILRVAERTPEAVVPFEEAKAEIGRKLNQNRWAQEFSKYIDGLRKNAVVDYKVREVPLQVTGPTTGGALLDAVTEEAGSQKAAPASGPVPADAPEFTTSPQSRPERVAPPPSAGEAAAEKKTDDKKPDDKKPSPQPTPQPTPPPSPPGNP